MDTFIKELKLEEIPDGPWKQVAEQIGVENLYTVLRIVGGGTTYIPKAETLIRPVRNRHIREEFNGCNYLELAKKYNVTDRIVRVICGPGYPEGQINLFDEVKAAISPQAQQVITDNLGSFDKYLTAVIEDAVLKVKQADPYITLSGELAEGVELPAAGGTQ